MKKFSLIVILLSFALSGYFYSLMPEEIAIHWNLYGQVDSYSSNHWTIFLFPFLSVVIFLFSLLVKKIDPLKDNIDKSKELFNRFIFSITLFFAYLQLLFIIWNLGYQFNMVQMMTPALAAIFYFSGDLIGKIERNWFIGIKTPWTLSSDLVWDETHKKGAQLFKLASIISLSGILIPRYLIFLVIGPILIFSLYLIIFSYLVYKKEL